jgi:hypothetical protein
MANQQLPHPERRRARLDDHYEHERQRELVKQTVHETLLSLGLEIDDPIKMQKDFQHLREWREASETLKSHGLTTLVGILLAGLLGAIWLGIKNTLGYH